MKQTKRILAIALALALGLALFAPAASAAAILRQPKPVILVFTGNDLKLAIDVTAPPDGYTLSIEWVEVDAYGEFLAGSIATGASVSIPIPRNDNWIDDFSIAFKQLSICAVVTYTEVEHGTISQILVSEPARVFIMPALGELLTNFWKFMQGDTTVGLAAIILGAPVFLPMLIFFFLPLYAMGYLGNLLVNMIF